MEKNFCNEDVVFEFDLDASSESSIFTAPVSNGEAETTTSGVIPGKSSCNDCPKGKALMDGTTSFSWNVALAPCPIASLAPPPSPNPGFSSVTFIAGGGSISGNSDFNDSESDKVMLDDAEGSCAGTWTCVPSSGGPPVTLPCSCKVTIKDSGQDNVTED